MGNKEEWSISYKQIGIIFISFSLGLIVALLISNSQTATSSNFTTTELIGFVLTVILSGASIVLAIAAISLGKSSEQAVMLRSDESIRLQTEVFTKTTDALQGIKASTDVTEKRIEDIISGRAGDLSKQIAEIATDETGVGNINLKDLEEKIRKSITQGFNKKENSNSDKEERAKRRRESMRKRKEYEFHHDELLLSIANKPDIKIERMSHGTPSNDEESINRYDAVFSKNNEKIAISTISPSSNTYMPNSYVEILQALAVPIENGDIQKLYLIIFQDNKEKAPDTNILNEVLSMMKDELASKISVSIVPYGETEEWIKELKL